MPRFTSPLNPPIRRSALAAIAAAAATVAVALAGCSASVATGTADNAIYNGRYVGAGTIQRSPSGYAAAPVQPTVVTITLSTLGSDFTGTLASALSAPASRYDGGVAGRVTSTGGDFTYVQSGCQGTLHGAFVLNGDGTISGSAVGRDCGAGATGDNVHIDFANLARQ